MNKQQARSMVQRLKRIQTFIIILIFTSCFNNAKHDNPLDPRSERFQNFGELQGYVYTYYAPFQPLSAAKISLFPGNQATVTDQKGSFSLMMISPGNYLVTVNREHYAADSARVNIAPNKTTNIQFNLDALPQLDTLTLITGFNHEHSPIEPTRLFHCAVTAIDPDGPADIAAVSVVIPHLEFKDTLGLSLVVGTYQKRYVESDLSLTRIEALLGHPIFIEISDKAGKICRSGPHYLTRVIDEEPEIEAPAKFALVGNQPKLIWKPSSLPFPFTFRVEIYIIVDNQISYPPQTFSQIDPAISSLQLSKPLPAGVYLWTISIVDEFGNWSRSKPATFQVGG